MQSIGIAICTFGDRTVWGPLARRARKSVLDQTRRPDQLLVYHGDTLQNARNHAAHTLETDSVVFLDADDWLHPRFIEKIVDVEGDLVQTAVRYWNGKTPRTPPFMLKQHNLLDENFLIIGTRASRQMILDAGGFRDLPAMEDWDLWIRCWLRGARITHCPKAVYNVTVAPVGRNMQTPAGMRKLIKETYVEEAKAKGLY